MDADEEPAASERLKVLKSKVADKELPERLFLCSTTFRPSTFTPPDFSLEAAARVD